MTKQEQAKHLQLSIMNDISSLLMSINHGEVSTPLHFLNSYASKLQKLTDLVENEQNTV